MPEITFPQLRDMVNEVSGLTTLITIKSKFNSVLNLLLIKHLVNEKGLKGIYISLERPSSYVRRMMEKRDIDLDKILFLDTVGKVSGEAHGDQSNIRSCENPFPVEVLESIIGSGEAGSSIIDREDIDFIIIDSVSVLSCYFDDRSLKTLLEAITSREGMTTLMAVDRSCNEELYGKVKAYCKREIRLGDDMELELI